MLLETINAPAGLSTGTRSAGAAIAVATVVSTIVVAMDRSGGGSNPLQILQGIAGLTLLKEMVHGVAIASVCAYAFGYISLSRRLGLQRPLVLTGLVVYLIGCVAMVAATLLDGFVTPHVAADAIRATDPGRIQFAYDLVHYIGVVLNDAAKLGWILQAVGAAAWSTVLLGQRGAARMVGALGWASSGLVCVLVAVSAVNMSMTSLLGVLVAQLVWNLAAAVYLFRRSIDPAS